MSLSTSSEFSITSAFGSTPLQNASESETINLEEICKLIGVYPREEDIKEIISKLPNKDLKDILQTFRDELKKIENRDIPIYFILGLVLFPDGFRKECMESFLQMLSIVKMLDHKEAKEYFKGMYAELKAIETLHERLEYVKNKTMDILETFKYSLITTEGYSYNFSIYFALGLVLFPEQQRKESLSLFLRLLRLLSILEKRKSREIEMVFREMYVELKDMGTVPARSAYVEEKVLRHIRHIENLFDNPQKYTKGHFPYIFEICNRFQPTIDVYPLIETLQYLKTDKERLEFVDMIEIQIRRVGAKIADFFDYLAEFPVRQRREEVEKLNPDSFTSIDSLTKAVQRIYLPSMPHQKAEQSDVVQIQGQVNFSDLPSEIVGQEIILRHCGLSEIARLCQVSRSIFAIANDNARWKELIYRDAFTAKKWELHCGIVGVEKPFPENIRQQLKEAWGKVIETQEKIAQKHNLTPELKLRTQPAQNMFRILFIPSTLGGKPFHPKSFGERIEELKAVNPSLPSLYSEFDPIIMANLGEKAPEDSHWLLISRRPVEGTAHRASMLCSVPGFKSPSILGQIALIFAESVETGKTFYNEEPFEIMARCEEWFWDQGYITYTKIGKFNPKNGMSVSTDGANFSDLAVAKTLLESYPLVSPPKLL